MIINQGSIMPKNTQAIQIDLPAPVFSLANENNALNWISSIATPLDVASYSNMQIGDIVTMYLIGFDSMEGGELVTNAEFSQAHIVLENNVKEGCGFFVPGKKLEAILYGRAEAYYEVVSNGLTSRSLTAHVLVDMRAYGCPHP
jgi:hypothetical protein